MDELFLLWLGLFRDHLGTALVLAGVLPIALLVNPALGAVLTVLALLFSGVVWLTVRRTEDAHTALSAQAGEVIGKARLVDAFGAVPTEAASFGRLAGAVLRHQLPVLGWWAGVTVTSRAASTAAMVTIIVLGAWLQLPASD